MIDIIKCMVSVAIFACGVCTGRGRYPMCALRHCDWLYHTHGRLYKLHVVSFRVRRALVWAYLIRWRAAGT
jgi:hypothetical protein